VLLVHSLLPACGLATLVSATAAVCALAADAADAGIVLGAEVALGGFAPAAADLCIEGGAMAVAHCRAALRADLAIELAAVFVARRSSAAPGRFGAGTRAWLAPRGRRGARGRLRIRGIGLFVAHVYEPFGESGLALARGRGAERSRGWPLKPPSVETELPPATDPYQRMAARL